MSVSRTRRAQPETRRSQLIAAARQVLAAKGVAGAAVSDIVKAAGVAQGTFYLYFASKDEIVDAVVEEMADAMIGSMEEAAAEPETAVDKLVAIVQSIVSVSSDPTGHALALIYHRPENRAMHDRLTDRYTARLVPLVEEIVRGGVAEGSFSVSDPEVAALFVLGGLHALEPTVMSHSGVAEAAATVTRCVLGALGCPMRDQGYVPAERFTSKP